LIGEWWEESRAAPRAGRAWRPTCARAVAPWTYARRAASKSGSLWKGPSAHKHGCGPSGCGLSEDARLIQKAEDVRGKLSRLSDVDNSAATLAMEDEALECAQSQIVQSASPHTSMAIFSYLGAAFRMKGSYQRAIAMSKLHIATTHHTIVNGKE